MANLFAWKNHKHDALNPPGTSLEYAGIVAPAGYVFEDGSTYLRTLYPDLFSAISLSFTGATTASASVNISGLTGMTSAMLGWGVAGDGIPSGTTIVTIVNATSVTISLAATVTQTGTASLVIGPHGFTGDNNTTTFNVPDHRGRVAVGSGTATGAAGATAHPLGQKSGEETHALTSAENGDHFHTTPGFTFIWGSPPGGTPVYANGAPVAAGNPPGNNLTTDQTNWNKTNSSGSGTPHNNMSPYIVMNHIIKT